MEGIKLREAIKVYKDYYACPCCSGGQNVVNEAAVYHTTSLTSREFECKDCRRVFKVPADVKITKPFKKRKKQGSNNG